MGSPFTSNSSHFLLTLLSVSHDVVPAPRRVDTGKAGPLAHVPNIPGIFFFCQGLDKKRAYEL